jgi:hypothetical protein
MEQQQIRPVRHQRTEPSTQEESEEIWPRSAREFLNPTSVSIRRKGFRYPKGSSDPLHDK